MEMFYPLAKLDLLKKNGKEIDPLLIASLIRQESGFNENARSRVGAAGLMQIMYPTARSMEKVSKKSLYEPNTNVRLGVRYFFGLLKKFDMDVELALAAYNAGPDKVTDWVRRYPVENRILFLDLIPFAETRNYVALIVRNYVWYQYLYGNLRDPLLPSAPIKVKTLGK
jgi:soluble lytic murein transglycosylase